MRCEVAQRRRVSGGCGQRGVEGGLVARGALRGIRPAVSCARRNAQSEACRASNSRSARTGTEGARCSAASSAARWRHASPPAAGALHVVRSRGVPQLVTGSAAGACAGATSARAASSGRTDSPARSAASNTSASHSTPSCQ